MTTLKNIFHCSSNQLVSLSLPNFVNESYFHCSSNQLANLLFLSDRDKKILAIKNLLLQKLRRDGLKRVMKVLKMRLYLPRLDELREELIWSPNHPGKFFTLLPKVGQW